MVCFVTDFTLFVADRLPPMRICDEKREYAMHADRSLRFDLEVADRQDMVTMPIFDEFCMHDIVAIGASCTWNNACQTLEIVAMPARQKAQCDICVADRLA